MTGSAAMSLLLEAHAAGLRTKVDGDRLVIRGPRHGEPLALALLDRKAEVMPLLAPALPAADLIRSGGCSASCLLALRDNPTDCTCTCRGRHHGALSATQVPTTEGVRP